MYHCFTSIPISYEKTPPGKGGIWFAQIILLLFSHCLVGHAAGGLASGLAGSLALAAAAGLNALSQVTSSDSLNTFHNRKPLSASIVSWHGTTHTMLSLCMITRTGADVKIFRGLLSPSPLGKAPKASVNLHLCNRAGHPVVSVPHAPHRDGVGHDILRQCVPENRYRQGGGYRCPPILHMRAMRFIVSVSAPSCEVPMEVMVSAPCWWAHVIRRWAYSCVMPDNCPGRQEDDVGSGLHKGSNVLLCHNVFRRLRKDPAACILPAARTMLSP